MSSAPTPLAPSHARPDRGRWRTRTLLLPALWAAIFVAAAQATPSYAPLPAIAAGGFDRPERIVSMEGLLTAEVAVAPGPDGPLAVWQDREGVSVRPVAGGDPPVRRIETLGVRGMWAGASGGDAVIVWVERDLRTGTSDLLARWRGETRSLLELRQSPRVAVVAGASRPEVALALPTTDGWRLGLLDWDGDLRLGAPRPETIHALDAARSEVGVRLAWLEGRDEVVLGRLDAEWRAFSADWRDGAADADAVAALGPARVRGGRDVALLGGPSGRDVAFTAPDGRVTVVDAEGTARTLASGTPLGWLGGAWLWFDDVFVRRMGDDGSIETVLRLPAAPERIAADEAAGIIGIVFSSGRYQGGLEVWGADDAEAYRSGPLERFALTMGWDPWRIGTAAGGHLLTALLVATLAAMVFTPVWWLGASLLARRPSRGHAAATLDGVVLGILSVIAVIVPIALRVAATGGPDAALLVDPAWLAAGTVAGTVVGWALSRGRDLEATVGRLLAAMLAGSTLLVVVAFGTVSAWQRLLTAGA
jgi:hypothetical protein